MSMTPAIRGAIERAIGLHAATGAVSDVAAHAAAHTVRLEAGKETAGKVGNQSAIAYMQEIQRQLIVSTPFIVQAAVADAVAGSRINELVPGGLNLDKAGNLAP